MQTFISYMKLTISNKNTRRNKIKYDDYKVLSKENKNSQMVADMNNLVIYDKAAQKEKKI